ncbi:hypothetical protein CBR_g56910 [Chara braunii]|uniref:Glycerol-3-phosphate dehydrogenase n=1 Tax=Chara braunii TaxID=69332 RepID=A0A388ME46_CHABU|nr:hypothetical protein CBR_g56910 [Chara braunii]|eukprot:GBG92749.1 hypothetical protein CBR_g56910 [Chara braunii]
MSRSRPMPHASSTSVLVAGTIGMNDAADVVVVCTIFVIDRPKSCILIVAGAGAMIDDVGDENVVAFFEVGIAVVVNVVDDAAICRAVVVDDDIVVGVEIAVHVIGEILPGADADNTFVHSSAFGLATAAYVGYYGYERGRPPEYLHKRPVAPSDILPRQNLESRQALLKRTTQLNALRSGSTAEEPFDVLVIGGGATGTGVALDAATRGLKVALVEREDFGAGTSSRSTKSVYGGITYLEKAVKGLSYPYLQLVRDSLRERANLLRNAPHLTYILPYWIPCYSWIDIPYFWIGAKLYDFLAGPSDLPRPSGFLSTRDALSDFPQLATVRRDGKTLKGLVVFYEGRTDDSRLCLNLACTAVLAGAVVVNHSSIVSLQHDKATPDLVKAQVQDHLATNPSDQDFEVYAKVVINATGPFCDSIRQMILKDGGRKDEGARDSEEAIKGYKPLLALSSGTHILLPAHYSPSHASVALWRTKDGRAMFMIPWMGKTIAGTTDTAVSEARRSPKPREEEIALILEAIGDHLSMQVHRDDVSSAWNGVRPLVAAEAENDDQRQASTRALVRDHVVRVDNDRFLTVVGGKLTTYRKMAEDAVDLAVRVGGFPNAKRCATDHLLLAGSYGWDALLFTTLLQNRPVSDDKTMMPNNTQSDHKHVERLQLSIFRRGCKEVSIDREVAEHLARSFGGQAKTVLEIARGENLGERLVSGYPVLEAEVAFSAREEFCQSAVDFIARRSRLAFLDVAAATKALPRIVDILGKEYGWGKRRKREELDAARKFLKTFEA